MNNEIAKPKTLSDLSQTQGSVDIVVPEAISDGRMSQEEIREINAFYKEFQMHCLDLIAKQKRFFTSHPATGSPKQTFDKVVSDYLALTKREPLARTSVQSPYRVIGYFLEEYLEGYRYEKRVETRYRNLDLEKQLPSSFFFATEGKVGVDFAPISYHLCHRLAYDISQLIDRSQGVAIPSDTGYRIENKQK